MGAKNGVRIGKVLCDLMRDNHIKTYELAEMSGVSTATIGRAKRNERVERSTARKIFDVFGVEWKRQNTTKKTKAAEPKKEPEQKTFRIMLEIKAFDLKDVLDKMIKVDSKYINLLSCFGIEGNIPVFKSYALEYLVENAEKKTLREWIDNE